MLSILSTILSWDDSEREKAGLQKVGKGKAPPMRRKGSAKDVERSAEEEAAMNEVSTYSSKSASLMIVILKLVCRVLDERVFPGSGSRFSFSPTWRLAFTWCQIAACILTVLANEFWTCNASTGQRAHTSHVFCFKFVNNGSWKFTCYR
jgi:hypothetical protein